MNLTITVSDLVNGGGTIDASDITISPATKENMANGETLDVTVSTDVPLIQAAGTYLGTIDIEADNGTDTTTIQASVTIIVNQAVTGTITFIDVTVGDEDQDREETATVDVTITNNGVYSVTGVVAVLNNVNSDYEANVTLSASTIPAGGSVTATVTAYLPDDQDGGVDKIGTITVTGTANSEALTTTKNLNVEAANYLRIDKVEVIADEDSDSVSDDGDEFDFKKDEEPKPGETITLEITIENTFNDNIDIEDIEVEVIGDGDLDWDESDDISKIKDDDDDIITFELDIDDDVDEDTYEIEITIEGEDENGAMHYDQWTVHMEVKQIDDDLRIDDLSFSPSYATCEDRTVRLVVDYKNVGEDDQSRAVIRVGNNALDYETVIRNLEIDSGDDETETISILLPRDVEAGNYIFEVEIFTSSDEDDITDVDSIALEVRCNGVVDDDEEDEAEEDDEETTVIEVITPTPTTPGNVVSTATGSPSKEFLGGSNNLYVVLLVVIVILLIVLIVMAGASAFGGNKKK